MQATINGQTLELVQGDIIQQQVDAIVNAANTTLLGGGGVDGAIHRKGGRRILEECRQVRALDYPAGLPTGAAVSTTAGALPARRVIHTVGPVWYGGGAGEERDLVNAWTASLEVALAEGLRTVAFPSISTGAYGYPKDRAARTAVRAVNEFIDDHPDGFDEIRVVLFSDADHAIWLKAVEDYTP